MVDQYAVVVVFWKTTGQRFIHPPPKYIRRAIRSPVVVRLHQAGTNCREGAILRAKSSWKLEPGDERQMGWAYPFEERSIYITAGTGTRVVVMNTDYDGSRTRGGRTQLRMGSCHRQGWYKDRACFAATPGRERR